MMSPRATRIFAGLSASKEQSDSLSTQVCKSAQYGAGSERSVRPGRYSWLTLPSRIRRLARLRSINRRSKADPLRRQNHRRVHTIILRESVPSGPPNCRDECASFESRASINRPDCAQRTPSALTTHGSQRCTEAHTDCRLRRPLAHSNLLRLAEKSRYRLGALIRSQPGSVRIVAIKSASYLCPLRRDLDRLALGTT